jgi:hypothetical protein
MKKGKTSRIREDGYVWCPRCADFLPPERFAPSPRGCGYLAYCRTCDAARSRRYARRRALADPDWYAQRLRRAYAASNTRRSQRNATQQAELHELFNAAYARLRARGLSDRAIARETGVDRVTLRIWRRGEGYRHHVVERLVAAAFLDPV